MTTDNLDYTGRLAAALRQGEEQQYNRTLIAIGVADLALPFDEIRRLGLDEMQAAMLGERFRTRILQAVMGEGTVNQAVDDTSSSAGPATSSTGNHHAN